MPVALVESGYKTSPVFRKRVQEGSNGRVQFLDVIVHLHHLIGKKTYSGI
jgi:hypothetical protein